MTGVTSSTVTTSTSLERSNQNFSFVTIYGIIRFWLRGYVLQYTLYLTKSRRWIDPESGLIVVKAGRDPVNDEVVVV